MAHDVVFAPEAVDDLRRLYSFISEQTGDGRGLGEIEADMYGEFGEQI